MRRTNLELPYHPSSPDTIKLLHTDISALPRDHHRYIMPATKKNPPSFSSQDSRIW